MSTLSPQLNLGQASNAGPKAQNEDFHGAILPDSSIQRWGCLVCVADGIGGCSDPRRASESAVRTLLNDYYATPESWSPIMALGRVTASINAWMFRDGQHLEMGLGTTLLAALFRGRRLTLLWAGDSRAYRYRNGTLERLTRDHLFPSPDTSLLTKAVGMDSSFHPDIRQEILHVGDRFILMTDGVWHVLNDLELTRLSKTETDPDKLAKRLVSLAEEKKSWDNATAVVVDVIGLPMEGIADIQREWENVPVIFPPKPGETLDGFRIIRKLHEGHQGILLEARDTQSEENVILKFPDAMAMEDPLAMEHFAREEWTGLRVQHPNVVTFRPQPPDRRSGVYFVMEAVEGHSLQNLLEGGKEVLPEAWVIDWMEQAARGLMALHRKGIIHRDVKPDNLMLGRNGKVTLVDLGTVRIQGLELGSEEVPGTRVVGGTPGFMAPELYAGERGDERSDLFALGVTGYFLLTGQPPFGQPESNVTPNFSTPKPITDLRPDVCPGLSALLEKCLAINPDKRFADMGELLAFLSDPTRMGEKKCVPLIARNPLRFYQAGFWIFLVTTIILTLLLFSGKSPISGSHVSNFAPVSRHSAKPIGYSFSCEQQFERL